MNFVPFTETLRHSTLEQPVGAVVSLGTAQLNDRQKVGVLLQLAAAQALLVPFAQSPRLGWFGADRAGVLRLVRPLPKSSRSSPERCRQVFLARSIQKLFSPSGEVVEGRGSARRVVRQLQPRWDQTLVDLGADRIVCDLLEAAPFLWEPSFAAARRSLVAESAHSRTKSTLNSTVDQRDREPFAPSRGDERSSMAHGVRLPARSSSDREVWVAGSGPFKRRLLDGARGFEEVVARVESEEGRGLWFGPRRQGDAIARAEVALEEGRYEEVLVLCAGDARRPKLLRFLAQVAVGRLRPARLSLAALERVVDERSEEFWRMVPAAIRLFANLGQTRSLRKWIAKALWVGRSADSRRSRVLAAQGYWDLGRLDDAERHLERVSCTRAEETVELHQTRALLHLGRGQASLAAAALHQGLRAGRRRMSRVRAGRLWTDLVSARVLSDDLKGAERAARHALRLLSGSEGPLSQTLALHNLAEVRIRRGLFVGAERVLERAESWNQASVNHRATAYDAELRARWCLARGELREAREKLQQACESLASRGETWNRDSLCVLQARVEGWLGRPESAAQWLQRAGAPTGILELEEVPALWWLAGDLEQARFSTAGVSARLWQRSMEGLRLRDVDWAPLSQLEPYRVARLVLDLVSIGVEVDSGRRSWAVRQFLQSQAGLCARLLQERGAFLLQALANSQSGAGGIEEPGAPLRRLFALVGEPEAELSFVRDGEVDPQIVVTGRNRGRTVEVRSSSGVWRLALEGYEPSEAPGNSDEALDLLTLLVRGLLPIPEPASLMPAPVQRPIVGGSAKLLEAIKRTRLLGAGDLPLLIGGETGTGKELFAQLAHDASCRCSAPLVAVNCAALSESLALSELFGHAKGAFTGADTERRGVFEEASGGTVFLDEIADLHPRAQGMLLRVLQEKEVSRLGENRSRKVDVRVIAATHRDLAEMVERGDFRSDLMFRLRVGTLQLPPLRDRGDDVRLLAERFLEPWNLGLSFAALRALGLNSWPGNVRELKSVLQAAAVVVAGLGRTEIDVGDLELHGGEAEPALSYHDWLNRQRRTKLEGALTDSGGNQAAAARALGLSRQAMSYLVRELGIAKSSK